MSSPNAFATDHGGQLLLTAEQQAILASPAPSAIIAALAGTGKTTTLACRAVQALRVQPHARVLVLAYSKSGVHAFQQRLRRLSNHLPANLHITTMERWCARVLRQRDPSVRFMTDTVELRAQAHQALLALEEQLQRQPDDRISLPGEVDMQAFGDFNRAAKKSLLLQRMQDEGRDAADFCEEYLLDYTQARLFMAYERLRRDPCDDVRYYAEGDCAYALACEDDDAAPLPRYDLVLFDEMHDLDLASLTVLRRLLQASDTRFLGAGDFNQHIEVQAWSVFQDKLHQLADFLPLPTCTLALTLSRRFGPAIAQAVNRWLPVSIQASSKRYSAVHIWSYEDDAHCIRQLLQAQASLPTRNAEKPPLTVILRHPQDAAALEWAIAHAGKTATLHGLPHFYEEREAALLLGLMYAHSLQAPDWKSQPCILGPRILERFIDSALYFGKGQVDARQPDSDLPTMAAQMHQYPQGIWRFLIGEHSMQGGQRNFAAFGDFLHLPLALQDDASALLRQADVWGLFAATPMPHDDRQRLRARVQDFMDLVAGLSVPQVLQQIAAMAPHKNQRFGAPADFQIMSIEQAKGQEFDAVALPFLAPGRFPAPAPHELAFLERNRLYVAMTRARQRLWLLQAAQRPMQAFAA